MALDEPRPEVIPSVDRPLTSRAGATGCGGETVPHFGLQWRIRDANISTSSLFFWFPREVGPADSKPKPPTHHGGLFPLFC